MLKELLNAGMQLQVSVRTDKKTIDRTENPNLKVKTFGRLRANISIGGIRFGLIEGMLNMRVEDSKIYTIWGEISSKGWRNELFTKNLLASLSKELPIDTIKNQCYLLITTLENGISNNRPLLSSYQSLMNVEVKDDQIVMTKAKSIIGAQNSKFKEEQKQLFALLKNKEETKAA